jgi:hypothetical protein
MMPRLLMKSWRIFSASSARSCLNFIKDSVSDGTSSGVGDGVGISVPTTFANPVPTSADYEEEAAADLIAALQFARSHPTLKYVIKPSLALLAWLITLVDAPPLDTMTRKQKVGRVVLVTVTLVVSCLFAAMLASLVIFVMERGHAMLVSRPELLSGLGIILASILVNTICVYALLQIKRADHKLIPPLPKPLADGS